MSESSIEHSNSNRTLSRLSGRILEWVRRYERHLSAGAFFLGFLGDTLFLPRIDTWGAYAVLGVYLAITMIAIFLAQLEDMERGVGRYITRARPILTLITQFFFGSLMSAIFVYYSRSASLIDSAPFLIILFVIFVGNEIARNQLRRLEFQLAILFFILVMGMTFAVPVYLGRMGTIVFLFSQLLAVGVLTLYVLTLSLCAPQIVARGKQVFIGSVVGIIVVLNMLHFLQLIPPLPLSLRVGEVYHNVFRTADGVYITLEEPATIRERFTQWYPRVHVDGSPLYFFSAVFAPTSFATSIVHEWQQYDESREKWVTHHRITFPISGGRTLGYRGYSIGENITPGKWRVRVETPEGALLGSRRFIMIPVTTPINYVEGTH